MQKKTKIEKKYIIILESKIQQISRFFNRRSIHFSPVKTF